MVTTKPSSSCLVCPRSALIALFLARAFLGGEPAAAQFGSIMGTVSEAGTSIPIEGATVLILDLAYTTIFAEAVSDPSGLYVTDFAIPAGTYAAVASAPGYACEIWDDLLWLCQPPAPAGTPITVDAGSQTTGIDFSLAPGGHVAGSVVDATTLTPVAGATVTVHDATGSEAASGITNFLGQYVAQPRLAPGAYRLGVTNPAGYIDEVFDDHVCYPLCDLALGDDVLVVPQAQTTANFLLALGGRMSGAVTARATGAPLPGAWVNLWDSTPSFVGVQFSPDGTFTSRGLPAGTYFAVASANYYESQVFQNRPCAVTCDPTAGTPIAVTVGTIRTAVDFALLQKVLRNGFNSGGSAFWSGGVGTDLCAHDACLFGGPLAATCDPCVETACSVLSYCCDLDWDENCIVEMNFHCVDQCDGY